MRLYTVSSHYNTQLGMLGALAIDQIPGIDQQMPWITQKIPSLAAVMVFELHKPASFDSADADSYAVKLVAQDGPGPNGTNPYFTIPLPCAEPGSAAEQLAGPGACSLATFMAYAAPRAMNTSAAWCTACNNNATQACQAAGAKQKLALLTDGTLTTDEAGAVGASSSGDGGGVAVWVPVVVAFLCFAGGAVAALAVAWGLQRRRLSRHQPFEQSDALVSPTSHV